MVSLESWLAGLPVGFRDGFVVLTRLPRSPPSYPLQKLSLEFLAGVPMRAALLWKSEDEKSILVNYSSSSSANNSPFPPPLILGKDDEKDDHDGGR